MSLIRMQNFALPPDFRFIGNSEWALRISIQTSSLRGSFAPQPEDLTRQLLPYAGPV